MLVAISKYDITPGEERGSFLHPGFKSKSREIGIRLFCLGHIDLMRLMYDKIVAVFRDDPVRRGDANSLGYAWNGIGAKPSPGSLAWDQWWM